MVIAMAGDNSSHNYDVIQYNMCVCVCAVW